MRGSPYIYKDGELFMPKIIKTERSFYIPTEEWICEMENETGSETEEQIKAQFDAEVAKIRESAPAGSIAQLPTKSKGLFVRMKNASGEWVDI